MRRLVWVLAYVAVLWTHLAVASLFPAQSAAPDVLLVGALLVGLLRGPLPGASAGIVLGMSGDIIAGRLMGLGGLTLALAGLIAGLASRRVFRENLLIIGVTSLVLSIGATLAYGIGARALGVGFGLVRAVWAVGLPVGLYSAFLVPVLYAISFRRFGAVAVSGSRDD